MNLQLPFITKLSAGVPKSVRTACWALIALLGAEGALRVRAWHRHGGAGPVAGIYQLDDQGRRQLKAGAAMSGSHRSLRINRHGFRGPDLDLPKPPGRVRIAALGDSTTFGMEAEGDEGIWALRLASELTGKGSATFDAINAAIPGNRLDDSLRILRERVAPLDPDFVILSHAATDIAAHARRQFGDEARQTEGDSPLSRQLEEHSLLINLLRVNAAAYTSRWLPGKRHDSLDQAGIKRFEGLLHEAAALCRSRRWQLVLCTTPRSFGDGPDQFALAATSLANNPALSLRGLNAAFDAYNDAVRRIARETETPLVDLDRMVPRGPGCFVDAIHFNDAGHRLVGRMVADALNPLIESTSLARSVP